MTEIVAILQGVYYLLSGLWPIGHMPSFLAVTGPKTDLWLVKTVGVLVAVIGAVLLTAGMRGHMSLEIILLAVGSAVGLTAIDVIFVVKRTITKIYLLDAGGEIVLLVLWAVSGLVG